MRVKISKRDDGMPDATVNANRLEVELEGEALDELTLVIERDSDLKEVRVSIGDEIVWSGLESSE